MTRTLVDGPETLRQVDRMLADAAPLLAVSCVVVGGICAMQARQLSRAAAVRQHTARD